MQCFFLRVKTECFEFQWLELKFLLKSGKREFEHGSSRNFNMTGAELDGMLLTVIGLFFRKLHEQKRQFHSMAQQAAQFLNENFQGNISIAELAKKLQCSEGHLFRKFKEFTGETPWAT